MTHSDISLIVLAGGIGARMCGENKLYMKVNDSFIAEELLRRLSPHFAKTILVVAAGEKEKALRTFGDIIKDLSIVLAEDRKSGRGPLEGLWVGLNTMSSEYGFVVGCDMPLVQAETVKKMAALSCGSDVTAARINGFTEPLHSVCSKRCLKAVNDAIVRGDKKLKDFYRDAQVNIVSEEELGEEARISFFNMNTPKDFETWLQFKAV
ncbi:MAG: molybdenum cofactor guanylyltransferase [Synergistes sp.]|nr:molybdenum cofactor guanylyltransferase [Synergistes sp.]